MAVDAEEVVVNRNRKETRNHQHKRDAEQNPLRYSGRSQLLSSSSA